MSNKSPESWINTILSALKDRDEAFGKSVLNDCGKQCCINHGTLDAAKSFWKRTRNLNDDEKFRLLKNEFLMDGISIHKESGMIYVECDACMCPIVSKNVRYNEFLNECTKGFAMAFVEAAFHKDAEFTTLKTVFRGDDKCLLAIRIINE